MSPNDILSAMADAYASCVSYRDTGSVVTRFLHQEPKDGHTSTKPFRTAFVRPDKFRFEYAHEGRRYIVWSHGQSTRTWWGVDPGVEEAESLGLALAGATGISSGSAHTVPVLLLPGVVSGRRLYDNLAEAALAGDENVGGAGCHLVALRYKENPDAFERLRRSVSAATAQRLERWANAPTLCWIDRESFLIRRIKDATQWETFGSETVTTYDPAFGVPIGEDELRFDPPGG
jgi:hypothetical protein